MTHQLHSTTWPTAAVRHALGPGFQVSSKSDRIIRSITKGNASLRRR